MATETELKLRFKSKHAARLRQHPWLRDTSPAKSKRMTGTYFDTPQRDLLRLRVGLRVRKEGGVLVQAMKTAGSGSGGLHQRQEWEAEVDKLEPDFSKLPPSAQDLLDEALRQNLETVFTTDFKRLLWDIEYRGSRFELCVDQGRVYNAGKGSLPISEIELELKSGEPQALYQAALELQTHLPLWIENESKAQRGYRLGLKKPPGVSPQPPGIVSLDENYSAGQALQAIVQHQLACFQHNESVFREEGKTQSLDYMLSALDHLQTVFKLYKAVLPKPYYLMIQDEVKWLYSLVAGLYQWHSLKQSLHLLRKYSHTADILQSFDKQISDKSQKYHSRLRTRLASQRYQRFLLESGVWLHDTRLPLLPSLQQNVREFAKRILRTRAKRVHGKHDISRRNAPRHLLGAVNFFGSLYNSAAVSAYIQNLTPLCDTLQILETNAALMELTRKAMPGMRVYQLLRGWNAAREYDILQHLAGEREVFLKQTAFWE